MLNKKLKIYSPHGKDQTNAVDVFLKEQGIGFDLTYGSVLPRSLALGENKHVIPCVYLDSLENNEFYIARFLEKVFPHKPLVILGENFKDNRMFLASLGVKPNEIIVMSKPENLTKAMKNYPAPYESMIITQDENGSNVLRTFSDALDRGCAVLPQITSLDLQFNLQARRVRNLDTDETVDITVSMAHFLKLLLENTDRIVTKKSLHRRLIQCNSGEQSDPKIVHVQKCLTVKRISGICPSFNERIENVHGQGYVYSTRHVRQRGIQVLTT